MLPPVSPTPPPSDTGSGDGDGSDDGSDGGAAAAIPAADSRRVLFYVLGLQSLRLLDSNTQLFDSSGSGNNNVF